jgi:hypothetical protein
VISGSKPLPPNVRAFGPAADLIRLAASGIEEGVLTAFVTNSDNTFNLSADEIIYLNDLGVPGSVVAATIQHDQTLKAGMAAGNVQSPAPDTASDQYPSAPAPTAAVVPPPESPDVAQVTPPPVDQVSDAAFYNGLSSYGTWVDVEGYGRCWQPAVVAVNPGWQPYLDGGHWVYTDCGWYWASDYSWGWAPFHYGRWFRHNRFGWCWIPDPVWGPSWVCWRYGDDCCGWAPLPPGASYRPGVGLVFFGQSAGVGFDFGLGVDAFVMVGFGDFRDHHLRHYALPRERVHEIFPRTVVITRVTGDHNGIVNHGPPPQRIATASHTEIHQVAIRDTIAARGGAVRADQAIRESRTGIVYHPQTEQAAGHSAPSPSHPASAAPTQARPGSAGNAVKTTPELSRTEAPRQSAPVNSAPQSQAGVLSQRVATHPAANQPAPPSYQATGRSVQTEPSHYAPAPVASAPAPRPAPEPAYQAPPRSEPSAGVRSAPVESRPAPSRSSPSGNSDQNSQHK